MQPFELTMQEIGYSLTTKLRKKKELIYGHGALHSAILMIN